ncbi:MAG TPA: bifunctional diaminohydroxyphosphoribosylaminopyrimidine deaminase/5-amino-6-(5-phosphoribosylamino)uracil reductase RibD [Phycisphaerales bacterium]|nr:bifunctional diaminohydroxyphosphoribosylaminopyrimidine deaminase/5-amino-6-(5-phosphoribosylamino)uracil reductase RibD [Phycisphaerales bacterium]
MTPSMQQTGALLDRAARIALRGHGNVEPNPMVGCVITDRNGRVIAEGHHRNCGGPHAEAIALEKAGAAAAGCHLYVTLEPCNHTGRTAPCSEAIIKAGITRVIYAHGDPNRIACGGAERLREAGIRVEYQSTRRTTELNAPHTHRCRTGRPWVIAKWAQTLDGRIATAEGDSKWISSERSRRLVHRERGRVDAILTGLGTVIADDPQLTARTVRRPRRVPERVIIDDQLEIPMETRLVRTAGEFKTIVCCDAQRLPSEKADALRKAGVELITLGPDGGIAPALASGFETRGWSNILVEAGGGLVGRLLGEGLVNEILTMIAPTILGDTSAVSSVRGRKTERIRDGLTLEPVDLRTRGSEFMGWYRVPAEITE